MVAYQKTSTLLHVDNINKSFDKKVVLRDINLEIKDIIRPDITQGQVVSLIGASGAGKSTLFYIMAGLLKQDSGNVFVNGSNLPIQTGDMGVVFQNYYLYSWRSIKAILNLAVSKNKAVKPNERKDAIESIANEFNFFEHLNKYPYQLSGGQKQRVAIAEQLLNGGNFILLDEPFSGLDALMIDKVLNILIKVSLSDELKTLIIVSHDLSNSIAISDTIFILGKEEGKEGATIKRTIDLIERDLAWHPDIKDDPRFREAIKEVKSLL